MVFFVVSVDVFGCFHSGYCSSCDSGCILKTKNKTKQNKTKQNTKHKTQNTNKNKNKNKNKKQQTKNKKQKTKNKKQKTKTKKTKKTKKMGQIIIIIEYGNENRQYSVEITQTVDSIRDLIETEFGIPKTASNLTVGGRLLIDNNQTLQQARIQAYDTILASTKVFFFFLFFFLFFFFTTIPK